MKVKRQATVTHSQLDAPQATLSCRSGRFACRRSGAGFLLGDEPACHTHHADHRHHDIDGRSRPVEPPYAHGVDDKQSGDQSHDVAEPLESLHDRLLSRAPSEAIACPSHARLYDGRCHRPPVGGRVVLLARWPDSTRGLAHAQSQRQSAAVGPSAHQALLVVRRDSPKIMNWPGGLVDHVGRGWDLRWYHQP
jgi:hypothetical protein